MDENKKENVPMELDSVGDKEIVQVEVKLEENKESVQVEIKLVETKETAKGETEPKEKKEEKKVVPPPVQLPVVLARMSVDTHAYDGKLKELVNYILEKYPSDIPFDDCISDIQKLVEQQNYPRKAEVHRCLQMFVQDRNNNLDPTNNVRIEVILPRLWTLVKQWELSAQLILLEQLADTIHGSCPQGRNTRLLQLFP